MKRLFKGKAKAILFLAFICVLLFAVVGCGPAGPAGPAGSAGAAGAKGSAGAAGATGAQGQAASGAEAALVVPSQVAKGGRIVDMYLSGC